jgi:hypothetical protein
MRRPCALVVSAQVSARDRKPPFAIGDHGEGIEKIPRRSRQPVEPGHHQHIIGVDLLERLAQLGAVSPRAARCLAEYLFASRLGELAHLGVNALTVG